MQYTVIPVTHYQQNCSLVWCEQTNRAALIDPGGESERLLNEIERRGLVLEKLLLTHGHMDHVGAALELSEQTGVPIIGPHQADAFWLEILPQQAEHFGFPPVPVFMPHQWLEEGDLVSIGEVKLAVLHCPGHTPGHVVFHHAASRTLFVGDVLFRGSIGRTDFPQGDHQALLRAIRDKLLSLDDDTTFIPGHGPSSTLGYERRHNPFL